MEAPKFFVPYSEAPERDYAALAASCGVLPLAPGKRIYSITFRHDSDWWTATVGRPLLGTRRRVTRKRGQRQPIEREERLSDPAEVLAIFSGIPFMVFTTAGIRHRSAWANPFLAGEPEYVTLFAVEKPPV